MESSAGGEIPGQKGISIARVFRSQASEALEVLQTTPQYGPYTLSSIRSARLFLHWCASAPALPPLLSLMAVIQRLRPSEQTMGSHYFPFQSVANDAWLRCWRLHDG